jgi:hypothetical protein
MLNLPYFYNATTKKAIMVFGSLFSNLSIARLDAQGNTVQTIKVPLSYAPKQKYLVRDQQEPDIDGNFLGAVLPRMAFEITGLQYDTTRKLNTNIRNTSASTGGNYQQNYNPVPYNVNIDLYILVKNQEDGLQIVEQILPIFTPQFNVTINTIASMSLTQDVPIILNSVSHEDNYDGDWMERREIVWTLSFTIQLNYFGPIDTSGNGVIKSVTATVYSDPALQNTHSKLGFNVTPFTANQTDPHTIVTTIEGW